MCGSSRWWVWLLVIGFQQSQRKTWQLTCDGWLGGGFQIIFIFTPTWGRFPFWLYNIFQMGWNHQLVGILDHYFSFLKSRRNLSKFATPTFHKIWCLVGAIFFTHDQLFQGWWFMLWVFSVVCFLFQLSSTASGIKLFFVRTGGPWCPNSLHFLRFPRNFDGLQTADRWVCSRFGRLPLQQRKLMNILVLFDGRNSAPVDR